MSVTTLAMLVGALISGPIADQFGRKFAVIISEIITGLGWVTASLARNFPALLTSNLFLGLGAGMAGQVTYLLLSEIALIKYRGIFANINSLVIILGNLFTFILHSYLAQGSLTILMVVSAIPVPLFLLLSYFISESPLWLLSKNKLKEAKDCLVNLRGNELSIITEIEDLNETLATYKTKQEASVFKIMKNRAILEPIAMMAWVFLFQAASGNDSIKYYSYTLFQEAQIDNLTENTLSVLLGSLENAADFSTAFFSHG